VIVTQVNRDILFFVSEHYRYYSTNNNFHPPLRDCSTVTSDGIGFHNRSSVW